MAEDLDDILKPTRRGFLRTMGEGTALLLAGGSLNCGGLNWDIYYGGFEVQEEADAKRIEISKKLVEYKPWIKVKEIKGTFYVVANVNMYGRDAKQLRDKHRFALGDNGIQMVNSRSDGLEDVIISAPNAPIKPELKDSSVMGKNEREVYLILKNLIQKTGFDHEYLPLLMSWIEHESAGFQPHIVSSAGAVGYTQLMPLIASHYGLKVSKECGKNKRKLDTLVETHKGDVKKLWSIDQRFHPTYNIYAGLMFLNHLCHKYGDSNYITNNALKVALMAYNTGETNVDAAIKATGSKNAKVIVRHGKIVKQARDYPGHIMTKVGKFVERITKYEKSLKTPT